MNLTTRALGALLAVLVLVAPLVALAAEVRDSTMPTTSGIPVSGDLGATFDGSRYWVLKSDENGNLKMVDMRPRELQNDAFIMADTLGNRPFVGVLRPLGLGWSVAPFGARSLTVTRYVAGAPRGLRLFLYGSDDDVTYVPVLAKDAWTITTAAGHADSSKVDTLGVYIPPTFQGTTTWRQFKIPIPEDVYPGRYLQIWATSTDSVAGSIYQAIGLVGEGRWR